MSRESKIFYDRAVRYGGILGFVLVALLLTADVLYKMGWW